MTFPPFERLFPAVLLAFALVGACAQPVERAVGTLHHDVNKMGVSDSISENTPQPRLAPAWKRCGATWYGQAYAQRETASGETFDPAELTVATLDRGIPFQAVLEVRSGRRRVLVRVTDRMGSPPPGRCLDLSRAAFERLAPAGVGVLEVEWRRAS